MTDQKQEKPKKPNWLVKASGDAVLAGGAVGLSSFAFGVPAEYAARVALAGGAFSLYLSWSNSTDRDRKPKQKRSVPFTSYQGSKRIDLEYAQPYIVRESYGTAILRFLGGKKQTIERQSIKEPAQHRYQNEQIFRSHYDNCEIELLGCHIKLFLKSAWKMRDYGKGLSQRRWIRYASQRSQWWQDLGSYWYYAFLNLLRDAEQILEKQLVVVMGNRWCMLKFDDWDTYQWLYQAEWIKNNKGVKI